MVIFKIDLENYVILKNDSVIELNPKEFKTHDFIYGKMSEKYILRNSYMKPFGKIFTMATATLLWFILVI